MYAIRSYYGFLRALAPWTRHRAADPDGDPTTSAEVPDVVQNSWGVTVATGQYLACDTRWYDVIDNRNNFV